MDIFKLVPAFKDYLWGGNKLRTDFGYESNLSKLAEAWVLSCHKDGINIIDNGKFKGRILNEVLSEHNELLGKHCDGLENFPILIKLIDAKKDLSVQVHPNNEYALKNEHEYGKTECWYILDCDEEAELIYGFKRNITKKEFEDGIKNNTFLDNVNKVKVHKGDFFFIESGTLHAIGKGILLAEIQQNSNTTYRVYDYGRLGADGKPRELHVKKALDVTKCEPPKYDYKPLGKLEKHSSYMSQLLTKCDLFEVKTVSVYNKFESYANDESFVSILITDGSGYIDDIEAKKGDSFFVPANYGKYTLLGKLNAIITTV